MRQVFGEFYLPQEEEERRFITEGTIVLDTNVLFDLYRFNASQREAVLEVLEMLKERLWIPYQVGLEYQRGRLARIKEAAGKFGKLVVITGVQDDETILDRLRGLKLDEKITSTVEPRLLEVSKTIRKVVEPYAEFIRELEAAQVVPSEDAVSSDPVRDRLDQLFAERVGPRPSDEAKAERQREAEDRIERLIPPGYKDKNKNDPDRQAGDYFLWAELLDYAEQTKETGRPFLFVTNDTKEDWYLLADKQPLGPRIELLREFAGRNSHGYHQVTLSDFLKLANKHLSGKVDEAVIAKASELSHVEDEDAGRDIDFERLRSLRAAYRNAVAEGREEEAAVLARQLEIFHSTSANRKSRQWRHRRNMEPAEEQRLLRSVLQKEILIHQEKVQDCLEQLKDPDHPSNESEERRAALRERLDHHQAELSRFTAAMAELNADLKDFEWRLRPSSDYYFQPGNVRTFVVGPRGDTDPEPAP